MKRGRVRRPALGAAIALAGAAALVCADARAAVEGTPPSKLYQDRLWGTVTTAGASMMLPDYRYYANRWLKNEESVQLSGIPDDAEVVKAYLWWSGSMHAPPEEGGVADEYVDLTMSDGTFYSNLRADDIAPGPERCHELSGYGGFYYCRREITNEVSAQGKGNYDSWPYTLARMDSHEGDCEIDPHCQARYGAFAISIVWAAQSYTHRRDVILYDGFMAMQERNGDPNIDFNGVTSFTLADFLVGEEPRGEFVYFGMEGDKQLGSPPFPDTNGDWIKLTTQGGGSGHLQNLSGMGQPPSPAFNLWNGSEGLGVDIDYFDIGDDGLGILRSFDRSMTVDLGSGDGVPGVIDPTFPDHDLVILGWVAVALDTLAPSFNNEQTDKTVNTPEAAPGEILTYTIKATNMGSAEATNAILRDAIPPGTTYEPDSTYVNGEKIPDVAGQSPLASGLNLGTMEPFPGTNSQVFVQFQVRIDDTVPAGTVIENTATIESDEIQPPVEVGRDSTTVIAPELGEARKTWELLPGGFSVPGPNSWVAYTVAIDNDGGKPASGVSLVDDVPANIADVGSLQVIGALPGYTAETELLGDHWRISVRDLTIPAGGTVYIKYNGRIFREDEFLDVGIQPDEIDGLVLENQGTVNAPYLAEPRPTDDPNDSTSDQDPTRITLVYAPVMSSSQKTVAVEGNPPTPGALVTYTISLSNTGNRPARIVDFVDIVDDGLDPSTITLDPRTTLPVQVNGNRIEYNSAVPFPVFPSPLPIYVVFSARIRADAAHETKINNTASVDIDPEPDLELRAPEITVIDEPLFTESTKSWSNAAGGPPAQPGEELTFTFEVKNTGTDADNVILEDPLDLSYLTYVPGSGGTYDAGSGTVTFTWANLLGGESAFAEFKVVVVDNPPGDTLTNCGRVKSDELADWIEIPCVEIPLQLVPRLSIVKAVESPLPARVSPGDSVEYSITVTNSGAAPASDLVVTDNLDDRLIFSNAIPVAEYDPPTSTLTWRRDELGPGEVWVLRVLVDVFSPMDPGFIDNTATLDAAEIDEPLQSTVRLEILSSYDLEFSKDVDVPRPADGSAVPGQTLTFTLKLKNRDDSTQVAQNIVVADPLGDLLDAGWLENIVPHDNGFWEDTQRAVVWMAPMVPELIALAPGQEVELTFEATIPRPHVDGQFENQAGYAVNADPGQIFLSDDPRDGTTSITDPQPTPIRVENGPAFWDFFKSVDRHYTQPNDTVSYTLQLSNSGTADAHEVEVRDTVDPGLQVDGASLTAGIGAITLVGGDEVVWTIPLLAAGQNTQATFEARVITDCQVPPAELPNQARVKADNSQEYLSQDPAPAPDMEQDGRTWVRVSCDPDLSDFTGTVSWTNASGNPAAIYPDYTKLNYEFVLRNSGGAPTPDPLSLAIFAPPGLVVDPASIENATLQGDQIVTQQFLLDPGEQLVIRFTATVAATVAPGTTIAVQARLLDRNGGEISRSDGDPVTAGIQPTTVVVDYPVLRQVRKDVEGEREVEPGTVVAYLITVRNAGTLEAQGVVIEDRVDANLEPVDLGGGTWDPGGRMLTWNLGDLPAGGDAVLIRFTARVGGTVPIGTEIYNQGSVIADEGLITSLTDDIYEPGPEDPTKVVVSGDVTFAKTVWEQRGTEFFQLGIDEKVARGNTIQYRVALQHATGSNTEVRDRVPVWLQNVRAISDGGVLASGEVRWTLGDLDPTSDFTLTFTADLRADAEPPSNRIENQAFFYIDGAESGGSDDPRTGAPGDGTVFYVLEPVDFSNTIKKVPSHETIPPDPDDRVVAAGEEVHYEIEVWNTGPQNSAYAYLFDPIPQWTEYVPGSTRLNGLAVPDAAGNRAPTSVWPGLLINSPNAEQGVVIPNHPARVEFYVRVDDDVPHGQVINNQAEVTADGIGRYLSDDERTGQLDDPTRITVGKVPSLNDTQKVALQSSVRPGENITYVIDIPNNGTAPARNVVFSDPIPANSQYIASSLVLNGRALTDVADGDEGRFDGSQVIVEIEELGILSSARIAFQVTALAEGWVINQGQVTADGLDPEPTDSDGNDANGDQPTRTSVGYQRDLEPSKNVEDLDGGAVLRGDELRYTIEIENTGNDPVADARVTDDIPEYTTYVDGSLVVPSGAVSDFQPPPAGAYGKGRITVTDILLLPGEKREIQFLVTIDDDAPRLGTVSNFAAVSATGVDRKETNRAEVLVGQTTGAAAARGYIFEDRGEPDGVFIPDGENADAVFAGFKVLAVIASEPDGQVWETESDEDGHFELLGLSAPEKYRFRVQTSTGAELSALSFDEEISQNQVVDVNLQINPTGRVYVASRGTLVQGAKVTLHNYDSAQDHNRGAEVAATDLPPGQQNQLTDRYGMYQFDPRPGLYVINVTPPTEMLLPLPSSSPPPTEGPAEGDPDHGFVVSSAEPDLRQDLHYHLELETGATDPTSVHHNHIPLDHISNMIRFDLRANKRDATAGEIVTFLGEATNRSPTDLLIDGSSGGVYVRAITPRGFRYVPGSARVEVELPNGRSYRVKTRQENNIEDSDRNLLFGPFNLFSGGKRVRLMFQTVIGGGVKQGEKTVRGTLQTATAVEGGAGVDAVEKDATARVRVIEDPLFERGYVVGKVFCDEDKDAWQDPGEAGVPDVEVYVDTGSYSVTDSAGKYHLQNLEPGLRAFKAAAHTLPPGAEFTTDETRLIRVSRGALVKVNFGVTCPTEQIRPEFVELAAPPEEEEDEEAEEPAVGAPPGSGNRRFAVTGNLLALTAAVDGRDLPTINVDAKLVGVQDAETSPNVHLESGALPAPLRFKARALTREDVRGWTLEILEREERRLHRIEGRGRPAGEITWDGKARDGKSFLSFGKVYDYQLTVRTVSGTLGFSPLRTFGADAFRVTVAPPSRAGVLIAGRPVRPDDNGFFSVLSEVPQSLARLGIKLIRTDGKGVEFRVPVPAASRPAPAAPSRRRVSGNLLALSAAIGDSDLPTVNVDAWIPAGSGAAAEGPPDLRLEGGALEPEVRWRTRVLTREEIQYWSVEIRGRDKGRLEYRIDGLGPPPGEIAWDGRSEEGQSTLEAGRIYDYQLVVRTTSGSLGFGTIRSFGVGLGGPVAVRVKGKPLVQIGATRLRPNENGFFAHDVDAAPGTVPLTVELTRADGKGVRLVAPQPEGAPAVVHSSASTEPTTPVELYGNLAERTAMLGGRPLDLALLGMVCELDLPAGAPPRLELRGASLARPARFKVELPTNEIATWHLVLGDTQGRALLVAAAGKGTPPPIVEWEGRKAAKRPLGPGLFSYRLVVRTAKGERGMSALRPVLFAAPTVELTLPAARLFAPGKAILTRKGRRALELELPKLRAAGGRVAVEVHSDEGKDPEAVLKLTQDRADAIRRFLLRLRFKPQAVSAVGMGDVQPLRPNNNRRNRALNRRAMLIAGAPPVASHVLPATQQAVLIDGREIPVDPQGSFKATLALPAGKTVPLAIELHDAEGRRALLSRQVDTRAPEPVEEHAPVGPVAGAGSAPEAPPSATASPAAAGEGAAPEAPEAERRVPVAETEAPAGQLMVELPPAGAPIRSEQYRLRGSTAVGNTVTVNGEAVEIKDSGAFEHVVTLEPGTNELVIECVDDSGNRSQVRREVEVDLDYWFLLAVGDGLIGNNKVDLDEMNDHTTVMVADDKVALHGRAAGYFKARIRGEKIFKDYRITGHFDTGKKQDRTVIDQMIDPERYYPIYGDASQEVRDVNSRGKFFVLVQADEKNELRAGNFQTEMEDGDLFRFDRTSFGGRAKVDHEFFEGHRSELNAFLTDTGNGAVHGHDELLGTGGSVYYLRHRDVLEGTEKVSLTVRDRDTGMILFQTPLLRDQDYSIRYPEGRLLMKNPVSSVVDASFLAAAGSASTLDGHPVYIVADYEAIGDGSGQLAWGVHARQTLFDRVTLGGGYVTEERFGGDPYELWGASTEVKLAERSAIRAEVAHSQASGADAFYSEDGGLSFSTLDNGEAHKGGYALKLTARTEVGEWLDKPEFLNLQAYYQYLENGFFSGTTLHERGQNKFGFSANYKVTDEDRLILRHDGNLAELPVADPTKGSSQAKLNKQITSLRYAHQEQAYTLTGEYSHTFSGREFSGSSDEIAMHTEAMAAGFKYNFTERWSAFLEQQVDVPHGTGAPDFSGRDVRSTLGAMFRWDEDLWITLAATETWHGQTGLQAGLKSALDDKTDVYIRERLGIDVDGDTTTTTILGGENRLSRRGRVFGEYQIDAGAGPDANRAVVGLANRWKILEGLFFDLAGERQQILSDSTGESARTVGSVGYEYLAQDWLKLSGRYELRYDEQEESKGGQDRLQFLTLNAGTWQWTRDLAFLARLNYSQTENLAYEWTEALLLELSAGVAYRPVNHDWFNVLVKYTKRIELRRDGLSGFGPQKWNADIFALVPVVELPFRVQLSESLVLRYRKEWVADLPEVSTLTLLSLSRINFHLTNSIDVGVEYRLLKTWLGELDLDLQHGLLTEVSYEFLNHVRLGVGYNFSRFSDNLYTNTNEDAHGFFFRVTGKY